MKNNIALVLLFTVMFIFTACSGNDETGWTPESLFELSFNAPADWKKELEDDCIYFYPTNDSNAGFLYVSGTITDRDLRGDAETKRTSIDYFIEEVKGYDGFIDDSIEYDLEIAGHYAVKHVSAWKDYDCVYYYIVTDNSFYIVGIDITDDSPSNMEDVLDNVIDSISINGIIDEESSKGPLDSAENSAGEVYENAIGKPAIDVYNELEQLGYKVSLTHAVTKMDFTTSIQYESDPTDVESYVPWIIVDVDSYSAASKTASFFINTQEMIDEIQSNSAVKDTLQAKLDVWYAWDAVQRYGEREFPYGFKLEKIKGKLAETVEDENTWFLKATCEVKNEYGTWMKNLVCEASVSGTTESPQIDYFYVY